MAYPGCFASASVFSHDSSWCKKCEVFRECSTASVETLQRIRETINVDQLLTKHMAAIGSTTNSGIVPLSMSSKVQSLDQAKSALTLDQKQKLNLIVNRRAAEYATGLCLKGFFSNIREDLKSGKNPLAGETTGQAMSLMIQTLLNGGFTIRSMVEMFVKDRKWTKQTAQVQTSMLLAILVAFDLVECSREGHYTLNRS